MSTKWKSLLPLTKVFFCCSNIFGFLHECHCKTFYYCDTNKAECLYILIDVWVSENIFHLHQSKWYNNDSISHNCMAFPTFNAPGSETYHTWSRSYATCDLLLASLQQSIHSYHSFYISLVLEAWKAFCPVIYNDTSWLYMYSYL